MAEDKYLGNEAVEVPVNGTLDLHTFDPRDVKELVSDYLDECLERGITEVNIIHGKGKGVLRRIVRAALDRHPAVVSYEYGGSWGSTVVLLERPRRSHGDSGKKGDIE